MEGKANTKGATVEEELDEDEDNEEGTSQSGNGEDTAEQKKGGSGNGGERTFTQSQVTRMMTREKKQGMNAVYNELGINPKDTKAVNMVKALIASQKSDEQKQTEKNAQEAEKAREFEERVLKAEIRAEAMVLGIKREYVDDMTALVMSKMKDDSDVKTLLGEYKKKYSGWFGGSDDDEDDDSGKAGNKKGQVGQRGTGSAIKDNGGKKSGKKNEEESSMGQRLAARRRASMPKKSFWS